MHLQMSRSRLLILTLMAVVVIACARVNNTNRATQREAEYQIARRSYSDVLKPGMSRKDVEDYLHNKGAAFRQMCCMGPNGMGVYDDLTKIGTERAPWNCSEHNVYIGFAFNPKVPVPTKGGPDANDSDILKEVRIFRWLEGCL
jgi:hypothetical protein